MTDSAESLYAFNRAQWAGLAAGLTLTAAGCLTQTGAERILFTALMGGLLTVLSVIDARRFLLPDALNAALALTGAVMVWRLVPSDWQAHAIGAAAGFLILLTVELAYKRLRGVDGLGRGDAKLLGAIGLWTGWIGLPSVLLIASAAGVAFGGAMALRGKNMSSAPIPFGPFLAAGGFAIWLFGPLGL